ncbi:MAG: putative NAD/FAD-binding protein [Polaribacter sp.]|jgi:predicted NAD/FAD-binding protein
MKIAIVGTGIAGNVAAYHLNKKHDITVYEAADYVGGHTHTHDINWQGDQQIIDTGFIVFNERTYPNFINLLDEIGVKYQNSDMSFSVQAKSAGIEYNGNSLNSLFAQRSNLFKPRFYRMIKDILRFNKESLELLDITSDSISLGEYLKLKEYSQQFVDHYIVPMGAAIWSTDHESMLAFPARFFVQFFHNHGMLSVDDRPQWHVIQGGSRSYLKPLIKAFKHKIKLSSAVEKIERHPVHVWVTANGEREQYDYVFIASHSDQALKLLEQPSQLEKEVLGAIPYKANQAILHTDDSVLPKRKLAWAAWNYHLLEEKQEGVALTYNMNILQGLKSKHTYCVSLNYKDHIDPTKIIKTLDYTHPFFSQTGVAAQAHHSEINGQNRTFYCGAYWRYGFHEDAVVSSLRALKDFDQHLTQQAEHATKLTNVKEIKNEEQSLLWSYTT